MMPAPSQPALPVHPPVHPRDEHVTTALRELNAFIREWSVRHGLTAAEYLATITRLINLQAESSLADERRPPKPVEVL